MSNPKSSSPDKLRTARDVFVTWLRERTASGGAVDIEQRCTAHPELADALRQLHSVFQLGQAAAASHSFQQSLREQFGRDAELTVKLEEGDEFTVPPSGGQAQAPAEGVEPNGRY